MYDYQNSQIKQQSFKKVRKLQKQKKLNSVRMFNFNNQWGYDVETNFPTQRQKNYTQMRHKTKNDKNNIEEQMNRKNTQTKIKFPIQKQNNQLKVNSQIFPKKKVFSNLQNPKFKNLYLENKISQKNVQPSIWLQNDYRDIQSEDSLQKNLIVHSKKLVGMKLPQINSVPRKKQIVVKMNLSNLKMVNIEERIKTMKYTPQKSEASSSFSSQIRFDNKVENSIKKSKKIDTNKPPKLHINQKQLIQQEKIISLQKQKHQIQKTKKSFFRIQKDKKNNLKQKTEAIKKQPQEINKLQQDLSLEVQEQKAQSFLPKIQVYDKKMKIGKKLKKQEDRIKAMLLKTLQKTKSIQYVAQCGSSQRNNSKQHSVNSHKRSLSKNSKQGADQKSKIILIQEQTVQNSPHNPLSKKIQMQNLKKILKPMHHKQYSAQIKNKKFVQMVRQAQNHKHQNINRKQLEEIKQQKTLINQQDSDNNQLSQNKLKNKDEILESSEKSEIKYKNYVQNEDEELNNQFLNVGKLLSIK